MFRPGGVILVLCAAVAAGCARPATNEPAVAADGPDGQPPAPERLPELAPKSRFFAKLSPARLDDIALRSGPKAKDPQWKWDGVASTMSFSPRPGEIDHIEAVRLVVADPAKIENFMKTFEGELQEEVRKSGATIPERAAGDPADTADAFAFAYADGTARGRVRSAITRDKDSSSYYKLVVRVEEAVAAKAP
jgi:hypothetical protein